MILNTDLQKIAKNILQEPNSSWRYIAFDVSYLGYGGDIERFKYAIQVLDLIFFYHRMQQSFDKLGFKKNIDSSILHEVINHVLKNEPFTDEQLIRYYELDKECETIMNSMYKLLKHNDYFLDQEIDFILLGLAETDFEICKDADEHFECDFDDPFFKAKNDHRTGNLEITDLVKILKKQVKEVKEKALELEIQKNKKAS